MIARRLVFLFSLLSTAAFSVPAIARTLPDFGQSRSPLDLSDAESHPTWDAELEFGPIVKGIGVGGAGFNLVEHMIACETNGIEFIYADTDTRALRRSTTHNTVRLDEPELCEGNKAALACDAEQVAEHAIRTAIHGAHLLFIAVGLGGNTGTVAAPLIARIAQEMGIMTVGIATMPFAREGLPRMDKANAGLAKLESGADSVIVVHNERLQEALDHERTQDEIFAYANDVLKNVVGGMVTILHVQGHVSLDFEEVRIIMSDVGGMALVGTAVASGPDRAGIAAQRALASSLLRGFDMSGAGGVLVIVSAAKGTLRLSESKLAVTLIRAHIPTDAHCIYGTFYDESLGEQLRITCIVTGVKSEV